jgi:hypothetical protein
MPAPRAEAHKAERRISDARFANAARFNAYHRLKVDATFRARRQVKLPKKAYI